MITNIQFKNNFQSSLVSIVFVMTIGLVDYYTGSEIALSVFYLVPILILSLQNNIKHHHIILTVILASGVWFLAEFITKNYSNIGFPIWNAFVRFAIFMLVSQLAYYLNQKHQKLIEINKKLENLNTEKNRLIGVAAHDLRNPIGNIYGFSDLLLTRYADKADPNAVQIYSYIKTISGNTIEMLEKLLDVSKIESGTVSLSLKRQEYVDFVRKYVSQNQMLAVNKQLKINFKPQMKEIFFSFDEHYLSEVLNNLLTNAIKFSYPNSEITVTVSEYKNYVKTEVTDSGKGIPKEEQKQLFQYFQKTSVKPTGDEKSTGLGLAIAKKIVMEHNGKIGMESEPEKGSTFYFELPKEIT